MALVLCTAVLPPLVDGLLLSHLHLQLALVLSLLCHTCTPLISRTHTSWHNRQLSAWAECMG